MAALNNATTTDGYTAATTLETPRTKRVNLQVANAAIYWQRGKGSPPAWDDQEEFLIPGPHSFDRSCDAVRVRSAKAGTPAQVTITTATPEELGANG